MVVRVMTSLGETLGVLDGRFLERRSITTAESRANGEGYIVVPKSNGNAQLLQMYQTLVMRPLTCMDSLVARLRAVMYFHTRATI